MSTNLSPFRRIGPPTRHTNPLRGRWGVFLGLEYKVLVFVDDANRVRTSKIAYFFLGWFVLFTFLETGSIQVPRNGTGVYRSRFCVIRNRWGPELR